MLAYLLWPVRYLQKNAQSLFNINYLLLNCVIGSLISLIYFSSSSVSGWASIVYISLSLFVQISLVYSIIYLLFFLLPKSLQKIFIPLVFAFIGLFIFTDTQIYSFFRFHFNSLVWNVLTTPGGWDSLGLKGFEIYVIIFVILFFTVTQYYLYSFCQKTKCSWLKPKMVFSWILSLLFVGSSIYAYGDLYDIYAITKVYNIVPTYQPLTVKRNFKRIFGYMPSPEVKFDPIVKSDLRYPLKDMRWGSVKTKYNVIVIVVDSFRTASFNKEVTPNILKFSEKSQVFANHYSGGNGTRNGIFSIFYGIYSSYWDQFLRKNQSPILFDRFQQLQYNMQVFSSAVQTFPEFKKNMYVKINDKVKDDYGDKEIYLRDEENLEDVAKFATSQKKPFFIYSYIISSHSPFSFPPDQIKFKPTLDKVNYMSLSDDQVRLELKNKYHNGLSYADSKVGELIDKLEKNKLLENTIVLITSDHGEEFLEHGHVGHASSFSPSQVRVPLIMFVPHKKPKVYKHITSHHDIVPTLMPLLGTLNDSSDYSHGVSLFDETIPRDIVACSWDDCAYIDKSGYLVFGTKSHTSYKVEFRDLNYEVIPKIEGFTPFRKTKLPLILGRMGEYLK